VLDRLGRELYERVREDAGAHAPGEADDRRDDGAEQHASDRRRRRQHERSADEAHHRLAAAPAREQRQRVADHRGRDRRPGAPPAAGDPAREARRERLGAVARERRPGAPRAELRERVPGARVAVAGPVQIHAVAPRDDRGHRDRAEQVADHHRRDVLHTCPSPPST